MNQEQLEQIAFRPGFIAALDQSGGSTPKALAAYGIKEDSYSNEDEMFDLVHDMRKRIITAPAFNSDFIIGAILFEQTMDRKIEGKYTSDYLWENKGIVPFVKVDKGLAEEKDGVQLMKDYPELDQLLKRAVERNIFGTKMRSVIKEANKEGIRSVVEQQFKWAQQILDAGLVPIIEPEVDIYSSKKDDVEEMLNEELLTHLGQLKENQKVVLKLTIPSLAETYAECADHPNVIRVVALSGGYSLEDATEKLRRNQYMIASFSRALVEKVSHEQSEEDFNDTLQTAVTTIFDASVNKE